MPSNLLAGTASVSVDGQTYMVSANFKYSPGKKTRESLTGMDGVHGYKEKWRAPSIAMQLRDWGGLTVENVNGMTNVTVVAELANGKTIIGRNMWSVEDQEVDSEDAVFDVKFEGPEVTETTTN
ncbi:phage tail tube protein [Burkholderia arboris]|uniref:Phage tail tube protein n=1 Tax=Burkholderia arboris TaxID=488730 RepID=A0ABZ3DNE2_9BURK|nr:phage tail tube protein [Burkholderia vietnamiensis]UEC03971.1 phage tail tube protein [Burkholderia vietnamiensis]HDR9036122.1 phage tail tube protein [Burkholderia vietnamiensis]